MRLSSFKSASKHPPRKHLQRALLLVDLKEKHYNWLCLNLCGSWFEEPSMFLNGNFVIITSLIFKVFFFLCGLIRDAWWSSQSVCRLGAHQFDLTLLSLFFSAQSNPTEMLEWRCQLYRFLSAQQYTEKFMVVMWIKVFVTMDLAGEVYREICCLCEIILCAIPLNLIKKTQECVFALVYGEFDHRLFIVVDWDLDNWRDCYHYKHLYTC